MMMLLFDVETFKKAYPDWFEPTSIEGLTLIVIFFFLLLLILGLCIKFFGAKLAQPGMKIDIFGRTVKLNNKEIDTLEKKNLATELKKKIPRFSPPAILTTDDKFKQQYKNINLEFYRYNEDNKEYILKEGCRYMPIEEIFHVIDLIYKSENVIE